MCTVCGCSGDGAKIENGKHDHKHHDHDHHGHNHGHKHHDHHHNHDHDGHHHHHGDNLDYGAGPARAHAPGLSQARMIEIEENILSKNDAYANKNRDFFAEKGILALNLVSSPGSGKTTLLVETIKALNSKFQMAVIEGDQQTSNDADRIRETGVKAIQVNTGKGCHLDGHMVGHALEHLELGGGSVCFIENVGNLVCPAAFDLGEKCKVAVLSITEGEDKPLKYPDMFAASSVLLLNKIDLAPYLDFDIAACEENAKRINPNIEIIKISAKTREGFDEWIAKINSMREEILNEAIKAQEAKIAALKSAM